MVVGDVDGDEVLRLAEEVLPKTSGPLIPRDYGVEEPLTPCQKETRGRMEIAMPTFMAGFKCPPQHGGEEQARSTALGELAIDVLAGRVQSSVCPAVQSGAAQRLLRVQL